MNQEMKEAPFDFDQWSEDGDIFYRPQDKTEFHRSLQAVVKEHLGLAVVADTDHVLNHYCRLMVARLRDLKEFQLEVLTPSNTETLLKRFNHIMASISVDTALRPAAEDAAVTLMIVNDAHLVDDDQWLLLSQLLSDFPGVNVRLVLFINSTEWPKYEEPLSLFAKKLYQWRLGTLSGVEAADLLYAAQQSGFGLEVEQLLSGLAIDIPAKAINFNSASASLATETANPQKMVPPIDDSVDSNVWWKMLATKFGEPGIYAWTVLTALVFAGSWGVMSIVNPGVVEGYLQKVETIFLSAKDSLVEEQSIATAPTLPMIREIQPKVVSQTIIEESKTRLPSQIIRTSKETDYFIQHILFKEKATAILYRSNNPSLRDAMIIPLKGVKSRGFGIVSGPFVSQARAQSYNRQFFPLDNGWIRDANQLQRSLY